MNNDLPKFKKNAPKNKGEKLIVELVSILHESTRAFVKLNESYFLGEGEGEEDVFKIVIDGAIGFAGEVSTNIAKSLVCKEDISPFLDGCNELFSAYIKKCKEEGNYK